MVSSSPPTFVSTMHARFSAYFSVCLRQGCRNSTLLRNHSLKPSSKYHNFYSLAKSFVRKWRNKNTLLSSSRYSYFHTQKQHIFENLFTWKIITFSGNTILPQPWFDQTTLDFEAIFAYSLFMRSFAVVFAAWKSQINIDRFAISHVSQWLLCALSLFIIFFHFARSLFPKSLVGWMGASTPSPSHFFLSTSRLCCLFDCNEMHTNLLQQTKHSSALFRIIYVTVLW